MNHDASGTLAGAHAHRPSPDHTSKVSRFLCVASAILCAVIISAFQLGALPVFQPLFAADTLYWPVIYYGFWSLTLLVSGFLFITNPKLRRSSLPLLILCFCAAAFTVFHPIESVAKNFIVAMILVGCTVILTLASSVTTVLRFSAYTVAFSSFICLSDVFFSDGFSNTPGRAAGLLGNPNVAAAALFLGAAVTFTVVSSKWRLSFLVLVLAALAATLSRSTALSAILVVLIVVLIEFLRSGLKRSPPDWLRQGISRAILVAMMAFAVIYTALLINDRYHIATADALGSLNDSAGGLLGKMNAVEIAILGLFRSDTFESALDQEPQETPSDAGSTARIKELGAAAVSAGRENSVSARALLFERSMLAYQTGPAFGRGLQEAHSLDPHNTYLLFLVAFGSVGALIPLGFSAFVFYLGWKTRRLPLSLAMSATMLFSHDVLLAPSLLVPIALGIAQLLEVPRAGVQRGQSVAVGRAMGTVAAGTFVAISIGCVAMYVKTNRIVLKQLDSRDIAHGSGYSYSVQLRRPEPLAGFFQVASSDRNLGGLVSTIRIYENGQQLTNYTNSIQSISQYGNG